MADSGKIISTRFFIAIPLSPAVNRALNLYCDQIARQHMGALQDTKTPQGSHKIRFTPESKRHMTLAFLGDLQKEKIKAARSVIHNIKYPRTTIKLTTIARFPDPQSKIITALPDVSKRLNDFHAQLQQSLEHSGLPTLTRPYRPHISLTRIKNLEDDLPIAIDPPIDMQLSEIILYESQITETGSRYLPMETTKFLTT